MDEAQASSRLSYVTKASKADSGDPAKICAVARWIASGDRSVGSV